MVTTRVERVDNIIVFSSTWLHLDGVRHEPERKKGVPTPIMFATPNGGVYIIPKLGWWKSARRWELLPGIGIIDGLKVHGDLTKET